VPDPQQPNASEVYRALAPPVLGYLRGQSVPDPEDVLGEIFLQVARDFHKFRGDGDALRRWVFSIAHNRIIDAQRRRGRDRSTPDPMDGAGGAEWIDATPGTTSTSPPEESVDPVLVAALAELSDDQREVIVLRFVADLPLEAVAKITGRKAGAVKSLQHRALENLRKAVSPEA